MTAPEFVQLKAFARIDGALLALLLAICFACYVAGLTSVTYGLMSMLTLLVTPIFVGIRLKRFRDESLDGVISFLRGWAYVAFMFFYGALLFSLLLYAYLAYMDHGYLLMALTDILSSAENAEAIKQLGMTEQVNESLHMLGAMSPIDFSLNMLTSTMMAGIVLGLPLAAIMRKGGNSQKQQ